MASMANDVRRKVDQNLTSKTKEKINFVISILVDEKQKQKCRLIYCEINIAKTFNNQSFFKSLRYLNFGQYYKKHDETLLQYFSEPGSFYNDKLKIVRNMLNLAVCLKMF